MVQIAEARPPYVTFEYRAEEDREASMAAGHYVSKDVAYALITPMGSKDRIERVAEEWLQKLSGDVQEGRFPREWLTAFRGAFQEWKAGREVPPNGTPIAQWPPASPAQVKNLLDLRVRTVEDLAQANEETLGRLGMGGRALKEKAITWLQSAEGNGKLAEAVSALQLENADLRARNTALEQQLKDLSAEVDSIIAKTAAPRKL